MALPHIISLLVHLERYEIVRYQQRTKVDDGPTLHSSDIKVCGKRLTMSISTCRISVKLFDTLELYIFHIFIFTLVFGRPLFVCLFCWQIWQ